MEIVDCFCRLINVFQCKNIRNYTTVTSSWGGGGDVGGSDILQLIKSEMSSASTKLLKKSF